MRIPDSRLPALPIAVGVIAGIGFAYLGFASAAIIAGMVGFAVCYVSKLHWWAFLCLVCSLGAVSATLHRPATTPSHALAAKQCAIIGKVWKMRDVGGDKQALLDVYAYRPTSDTAWVELPHPFRSVVKHYNNAYMLGTDDVVALVAAVRPLPNLTGVPLEFDYNIRLKQMGVSSMLLVYDSPAKVAREGQEGFVQRARANLEWDIVRAPYSEAVSRFMLATLAGDPTVLGSDVKEMYTTTGTAHILALSGLHVGILVSLLSIFFFPIKPFKYGTLIKGVVSGALVWLYAIVVGLPPSVVRAATMISIVLISMVVEQRVQPLNTFLLAVAVVLLIDPWCFKSGGVYMSFGAVGAIMLFASLVPKSLQRSRVKLWLVNLFGLPIVAMIGTSLISMLYFGFFPSAFLISNVLIALFFPLLLRLGAITVALTAFGFESVILGKTTDVVYVCMDGVMRFVYNLHIPNIDGIQFSPVIIIPYFLALLFGVAAIHKRADWRNRISKSKAYALTASICALAIIPLYHFTKEEREPAELYIPSSDLNGVILTHNDRALLLHCTDSVDRQALINEYNRVYSRFLGLYGSKEFEVVEHDMEAGPYAIRGKKLMAGGKSYLLVNGASLTDTTQARVDYALLGNRYRGSIKDIIKAAHPDTVLLSAGLHPSTRARLIKECADSVAFINLRETHFRRSVQNISAKRVDI